MRCLACSSGDRYEIVGDHAESDPTLHSIVALISTAIEAIAPLDHADASFASGAPFLAVAEPTLLCSRLRSGLLLERLGMHTRLTPIAFAAASFLAE